MNRLPQPSNLTLAFLTIAIALLFATQVFASHPYHVSKSEVEWNAKTGNFQVAMCVWPADLEKALAAQNDKIIDLDKVEELDTLLKTYVESKFIVRRTATGKNAVEEKAETPAGTIRWVGHEKNNKEAWLYFEIAGDKTPADWTIESRVFFELNEDQLNQIQFKIKQDTRSFISTVSARPHAIKTIASMINSKIVIKKVATEGSKIITNSGKK